MASNPDTHARLNDAEYYAYRDKLYYEMVDGAYSLKFSDDVFRCPYCYRKKRREYSYEELLQHGIDHRASRYSTDKEKAAHSALVRYMQKHLHTETEQQQQHPKLKVEQSKSSVQGATFDAESSISEQPSQITVIHGPAKEATSEESFVWPWIGFLANVSRDLVDGKYVGGSGSKDKDTLAREGLRPLKVQPLWNENGHSGISLVEFGKDWLGFSHLMKFETTFEAKCCGKRDFTALRGSDDKNLYGWAARADDFRQANIVGFTLQKKGNVKTVEEIQAEENRKHKTLLTDLAAKLEKKEKNIEEIENKYAKPAQSFTAVEQQTSEIITGYNKAIVKIHQRQREQLTTMLNAGDSKRKELETERIQLENREKQLQKLDRKNESEIQKLCELKTMNERALLEQTRVNEDVLKLAEDQKREKETLHIQLLALQKNLDLKQQLELEIECLKGSLQVMKRASMQHAVGFLLLERFYNGSQWSTKGKMRERLNQWVLIT